MMQNAEFVLNLSMRLKNFIAVKAAVLSPLSEVSLFIGMLSTQSATRNTLK